MPRGKEHYPAWKAVHFSHLPERLYRYLDMKGGIGTLSTQELWCSSPLRFNDPFDIQWDTMWQFDTPAFYEALLDARCDLVFGESDLTTVEYPEARALYLEWRSRWKSLPPTERRQKLAEVTPPVERNRNHARTMEQLARMRVLCLAERHDCLLMWAHYADKHHGIVLEFDPRVLCDRWLTPVFRVRYAECLPSMYDDLSVAARNWALGRTTLPDTQRFAETRTLTKFKTWEYEKEWRFPWLLPLGTNEPEPLKQRFPQEALTAVYFGLQVSPESRASVRQILRERYPSAVAKEAQKATDRFGLTFSD